MKKLIYILILMPFLVLAQKLKIGDEVYGGVVFHLDKTKKHGLVVSTENVGDRGKYVWGCYGNSIEGAGGIKIGRVERIPLQFQIHVKMCYTQHRPV